MAIQFNCPNCDALIAFDDKHVGKRGRCLTCGHLFIIPAKAGEPAQKIELKLAKAEPVPGFYRAVFVDCWKLFIDPENATTLVFVVAVVCFRFFLARACCCNYVSYVVIWGWLLGFYLNIIYETVYDIDTLPQIYLGTSITFLWYIIKPFLIFFSTMVMVQLPFIIALTRWHGVDLTGQSMWRMPIILQVLFLFGLFLFPAAILTIAVGKDFALLRPDYLFAPVFRAFVPYIVVVAWLVAAGTLEMQTSEYTGAGPGATARDLSLNLAVQVVAIMAMRSIGLFHRHYSCYFAW
jgi:hypothetical protein